AAVDLELRMRGVFDLQQQVAAVRALAAQPDHLPGADPARHAHVERAPVDRDPHAVAAVHGFQRDREPGAGVAHALPARGLARAIGAAGGPAPEQALEEIAEAAARAAAGKHLVEIEAARARARSEEHTSELQSRENLVCRL